MLLVWFCSIGRVEQRDGGVQGSKQREQGKPWISGARLFSLVPSDRTRDSGYKLKHLKFHLNTRKHNFTVREVVWSPSVNIIITQLDMYLGNLLKLTLLEQEGWTTQSHDVHPTINDSV